MFGKSLTCGKQVVLFGILVFMYLNISIPLFTLEKKEYNIFIVLDTIDMWSIGIREGFKKSLDESLSESGASAVYTEFNTEVDPAKVSLIITAIKQGQPDLIICATYPDGFADTNITLKLTDQKYSFISSNPIPIQTGIIKNMEKPGGNVTGIGVFLQQNSMIKLGKMINPKTKKILFVSWSAMPDVNAWYEIELKKACIQEGVELASFKIVKNIEEEFALLSEWDKKGPEYMALIGISAFVRRDGSPLDANALEPVFIREKLKHLNVLSYDDTMIKLGYVAGTCVFWNDIGAQMAEKGVRILDGTKPGDLSWDYPRKYNIVLNLKAAKDKGLVFPQSLIEAAYRVYTDYNGNFLGK